MTISNLTQLVYVFFIKLIYIYDKNLIKIYYGISAKL